MQSTPFTIHRSGRIGFFIFGTQEFLFFSFSFFAMLKKIINSTENAHCLVFYVTMVSHCFHFSGALHTRLLRDFSSTRHRIFTLSQSTYRGDKKYWIACCRCSCSEFCQRQVLNAFICSKGEPDWGLHVSLGSCVSDLLKVYERISCSQKSRLILGEIRLLLPVFGELLYKWLYCHFYTEVNILSQ